MAKDSAIQFKGTTLKIIQVQLRTTELAELHAALADLTGNAPDFFENDLAVLDFSAAENLPDSVDWTGLRKLLACSGLHAAATLGLPGSMAEAASAAGLPAIAGDALSRPQKPRAAAASETPPAQEAPPAPAPAAAEPPPPPPPEPAARTMTIDKPLRSGQRVYAKGCDLIITAMVSAGAEVIADGNIHVYAPLRGRALAGASGDKRARIFTTSLEAELVSVAGLYRTFESGVPADLARQPATISLSGEGSEQQLSIEALALR